MGRAGGLLAGAAALMLWAAPAAQGSTLTVARIDTGRTIAVVAALEGSSASGYVLALRGGALRAIEPDGTLREVPVLAGIPGTEDGAEVTTAWDIAFAPDHADSGKAYLSYTLRRDTPEGNESNHVVAEITRDADDPSRFDPDSLRTILVVPHGNARGGAHFGGAIDFGPDGMLYVTTGDSWLPREGLNVAQRTDDLRGAILRIDPRGDDFPDDPLRNHAIPAGNSDFGDGADPALWAIGLRNPFKGRWDAQTGRYFVADVGEDAWEGINLGAAGANYG